MTAAPEGADAKDRLRRHVECRRDTPQWRAYTEVRDKVLALKDLEERRLSGVNQPSAYWMEELAGFDYLLDASPLIVDKLRHQCYHVSGIKDYEYRSHHQARSKQLEDKLRALQQLGGQQLLVPESRALGGFGYEIDGDLYNIDTLKFYEVLIAMQLGGVLRPFREGDERRVAVEVGAGWGGFAYTFKTVCPNSTYVIVDFPELFIYSATYLKTLFPDATFLFYGDDGRSPEELLEGTLDADFVFFPHTAVEQLKPPRLDLVLNMVSFQEMTSEQVRQYVDWAADTGAPYLYSLNRDRSPYNPELSEVSSIIAQRFRPSEVPVLPVGYTQWLPPKWKSPLLRAKIKPPPGTPYRHIVGWAKAGSR